MNFHSDYELRDGASYKKDGESHLYSIPLNQKETHRTFDTLHRALWNLDGIAINTDDESYSSAFTYASRRFSRLFLKAFEYEDSTKLRKWEIPPIGKIRDKLFHYGKETEPMTITLEKTKYKLQIKYKPGFNANDETLTVHKDEESPLKRYALKNCGQGIKDTHAPYNPFPTEKWRYNPSKVSVSLKIENEDVTLGIENHPPKQPYWYKLWKPLAMTSTPYAYPTFKMRDQTRTVRWVYNQNHDQPEIY